MNDSIIKAARNGNMPLNIVSRGIFSATPFITYTFTPTGGVIVAISKISTNSLGLSNH